MFMFLRQDVNICVAMKTRCLSLTSRSFRKYSTTLLSFVVIKTIHKDVWTLFISHCYEAEKMTLLKLVILLANSKVYKTMKMAVDKWLTRDCARCCAWRQVPTLQSHFSTLINFYCVRVFYWICVSYDKKRCHSHLSWRKSCVE